MSEGALSLPDPTISRRHCRIYLSDNGTWFLEDLQSSNGTFLRGIRLRKKPCVLRDGDLLRVGNSVLLFMKE